MSESPILTYQGEPFTKKHECLMELGYALIWLTYDAPEHVSTSPDPRVRPAVEAQKRRVDVLIKEYKANQFKYKPTDKYWKEFLVRIINEIENM